MENMEMLQSNIENLKNAYNDILTAMNNLKDIDGLDEEYKMLDNIAQAIDDLRLNYESQLENLEEEAYMKENELQWKAEQKEQELEYWNSQF